MSYYQPLFDLMSNEHDLNLLESEMQDIIWVVEEIINKERALKWWKSLHWIEAKNLSTKHFGEADLDENNIVTMYKEEVLK